MKSTSKTPFPTSEWLPGPKTGRTIATVLYGIQIYTIYVGKGIEIKAGKPPVSLETDERLTKALIRQRTPVERKRNPLAEAMKCAELLEEPGIVSKAQVAARLGVSRPRVCQMLNLLELAPSIKKYLLSIIDAREHNYFTERKLRELTRFRDSDAQLHMFRELIQKFHSGDRFFQESQV